MQIDIANIRKIIHIDMDAFYASVEQRDFPELRGKPVAVGGSRARGVVCAASYEARAFGVRSAMSSSEAIRRCPELIFTKVRMDDYRAIAEKIRAIFKQYTDLVEPLSLDEAYLDVTDNQMHDGSAIKLAHHIRSDIYGTTRLTASAGVSFNKFLAKTASGMNKPNGYTVILPCDAQAFLDALPIEKFHGIGKVTAHRMHDYQIRTGYDLRQKSADFLSQTFGKSGLFYYNIVRGNDNRAVNPARIRKSVSAENTFNENITEPDDIHARIAETANRLIQRLDKVKKTGRTFTIKIKYHDFTIASKSITVPIVNTGQNEMTALAFALYMQLPETKKSIRLIGLKISNFIEDTEPQLSLFG